MTFFSRMEFNTFSWVLQDISMLFIKICVISITLTTIWQIILFLTFFYTSIWHRICTLCPIFRYMILLNLDTCIPIIEISIYNSCIGGDCSTSSTLLYDGHEEEIGLKRKDMKGIFWRRTMTGWYENVFCKNKRNLMLPFVKWKACAFCSRAIAYIKTQLHWTSLNNFAFTNDVNKKDFRQNNTSTIFPFHQLFNSKLYTYI